MAIIRWGTSPWPFVQAQTPPPRSHREMRPGRSGCKAPTNFRAHYWEPAIPPPNAVKGRNESSWLAVGTVRCNTMARHTCLLYTRRRVQE